MKISNLKKIKVAGCVIASLNLLSVTGAFASGNSLWKLIYVLSFVTMLLILINLRTIEIEKSGDCFSLKERHPFSEKKYVPSKIEFPLSLINEFSISKGLFIDNIYIKIQGSPAEKKIKIDLPFFTRQQILNIRKLLEIRVNEAFE